MDSSVDAYSSSLFEWTNICLKFNYIILQEVSGSKPQEDVVDRSKSIIETSGKMFACWDFLQNLRTSFVESLVVKAIALASINL